MKKLTNTINTINNNNKEDNTMVLELNVMYTLEQLYNLLSGDYREKFSIGVLAKNGYFVDVDCSGKFEFLDNNIVKITDINYYSKMLKFSSDLTILLENGIINNAHDYNLFADNATSEIFDSTSLEFVDLRICLNEDGSKFAEIYVPKDGEDVKQNIRFYCNCEECDNYNDLSECWN